MSPLKAAVESPSIDTAGLGVSVVGLVSAVSVVLSVVLDILSAIDTCTYILTMFSCLKGASYSAGVHQCTIEPISNNLGTRMWDRICNPGVYGNTNGGSAHKRCSGNAHTRVTVRIMHVVWSCNVTPETECKARIQLGCAKFRPAEV
ncbi:hypothetical protein C8J57DRAFT_1522728 [Mycena rebaudengoi]|nr:hypothetical protein C8J57DRAFT_1522728 [Mycena rebaudengoi]